MPISWGGKPQGNGLPPGMKGLCGRAYRYFSGKRGLNPHGVSEALLYRVWSEECGIGIPLERVRNADSQASPRSMDLEFAS